LLLSLAILSKFEGLANAAELKPQVFPIALLAIGLFHLQVTGSTALQTRFHSISKSPTISFKKLIG
jgi:hypothetical protein